MAKSVPSHTFAQTIAPTEPVEHYKPCCDPCPCGSLQCGAKAIAVFTVIFCSFSVISGVIILCVGERSGDDLILSNQPPLNFAAVILGTLLYAVWGIFAIFLWLGATNLSLWKCLVYFIGTSITALGFIILFIITLATDQLIVNLLAEVLFILPSSYFLLVVYFFMKELKFNAVRPVLLVPDQESQPGVVRPLPTDVAASDL